ncbi:MAG: polymerase [Hydrocarboniphaga sp.]|uniref:LexA family protein n=1 Tax=Hydrocarboniphaga sp. TaxID=2033016 RepID=UPI0026169C0E|nr:S24 family peptidase [Hydrocarboniphaga sp.]MDB5970441.1 polymerase [Hydrocarboniphaga sp.]
MPKGGFRPGAGRPAGTGSRYPGESTRTLRVPENAMPAIVSYLSSYRLQLLAAQLPSEAAMIDPPEMLLGEVSVRVPAGAAMPADDDLDFGVDLNRLLVRRADKTRIFTVEGDSMDLAGIGEGDKLIVDCGLEARDGDIVIAIILADGHTVKRLSTKGPRPKLVPESSNPIHQVREIQDEDEWMVWGVVTGLIKRFR